MDFCFSICGFYSTYYHSTFNSPGHLLSYLIPGETAYVMLKSYKEEYIFTDTAFIAVIGNSTIGTKKHVRRYDYCEHRFTMVTLRTPGIASLDRDGTLHFHISGQEHVIDIKKEFFENVKPLYRCLILMQRTQNQNAYALDMQRNTMSKMVLQVNDPQHVGELSMDIAHATIARYCPVSYANVWQQVLGKGNAQNAL